jgi:hypothetical protein
LDVFVDPEATGARDLEHPVLGSQSADEVRRSALLQVTNMGAQVLGKGEKSEKRKRSEKTATIPNQTGQHRNIPNQHLANT